MLDDRFNCHLKLKFISNCQKWCSSCYIIYTGCRYCLITNIIFGLSDRSQCIKCKRILSILIDIKNISSGNIDIDAFLHSSRLDTSIIHKIADNMNSSYPLNVYDFHLESVMEWVPYFQIRNLKKIAEGGYGIIYQ